MYYYLHKDLNIGENAVFIPKIINNITYAILPEYNNQKFYLKKDDQKIKCNKEYIGEKLNDDFFSVKYVNQENFKEYFQEYYYIKKVIKILQDWKIEDDVIQKIINIYHLQENDAEDEFQIFEKRNPYIFLMHCQNDILQVVKNKE